MLFLYPIRIKEKADLLKSLASLLLVSVLLVSCEKKNATSETLTEVSNVNYQSLIPATDGNYLVVAQQKIRFLGRQGAEALDVSSIQPFTELAYEAVRGSRDTLYIQTEDAILLYVKAAGTAAINWNQTAKIAGISPCDKFAVHFPYLFVATGAAGCRTAATPKLLVYSLRDFTSPAKVDSFSTAPPLSLVAAQNGAFFLGTEGSLGTVSVQNDTTAKLTNLTSVVGANALSVAGSRVLVSTPNTLQQYQLTTDNKLELLSSIPLR